MDPYSILGVPRSATTEEIKRAYRALAKKWHPDLNTSPEAKTKFGEIQQAYDHLVNGKPFKASPRHSSYQPPQQPPRPSPRPSPTQPHQQQSYTMQAEKTRKRQMAGRKRQDAQRRAMSQRAEEKRQFSANLQANRHQMSESLSDARTAFATQTAIARGTANSRLEAARIEYANLVARINRERDEAIQEATARRDRRTAEAIRVKEAMEQGLVAQDAANEQAFQQEMQRIEQQYQADLDAIG